MGSRYIVGKGHILVLPLSQTKDPLNQARSLMKMPVDPCLGGKDEDLAEPPQVKRAKTGQFVQDTMLDQPLRMVPSQAVHCSRILHSNFSLVVEAIDILLSPKP